MTSKAGCAGTVLTIAGHDGSNGAGITKDLDVFSALGLFGLSAPTAFVVQGPRGVRAIHPVDESTLSEMLVQAEEGFSIRGIKIGVVPRKGQWEIIAQFVSRHRDAFVVLDPVFRAKNGIPLTGEDGLAGMRRDLLPLVDCVTPNLDEAGVLLGRPITNEGEMIQGARDIVSMGPGAVVIKGGHLVGDPTDVLFDGREMVRYQRTRVERTVHGTGCIFSSALLSLHVRGCTLKVAFFSAEDFTGKLILDSFQPLENGYFYTSPAYGAACAPANSDEELITKTEKLTS